ncbi:MAG: dihydrofolate reductase [Floccifex sp.]
MNLVQIAAIGKNHELGKDNQLIWHLKEDMKFFRQQTKEHIIVMGRKTFESLPGLLPKRHHIVISRTHPSLPEEVEVFESIESFLESYKDYSQDIYVIGGAQIYKAFLPYSSRLILTEIDASFDADAFYPNFDVNLYNRKELTDIEENGFHYHHVEYTKKDN